MEESGSSLSEPLPPQPSEIQRAHPVRSAPSSEALSETSHASMAATALEMNSDMNSNSSYNNSNNNNNSNNAPQALTVSTTMSTTGLVRRPTLNSASSSTIPKPNLRIDTSQSAASSLVRRQSQHSTHSIHSGINHNNNGSNSYEQFNLSRNKSVSGAIQQQQQHQQQQRLSTGVSHDSANVNVKENENNTEAMQIESNSSSNNNNNSEKSNMLLAEIMERYGDNAELLQLLVSAKIEEDKRKQEEERRKTEEIKLQRLQLEREQREHQQHHQYHQHHPMSAAAVASPSGLHFGGLRLSSPYTTHPPFNSHQATSGSENVLNNHPRIIEGPPLVAVLEPNPNDPSSATVAYLQPVDSIFTPNSGLINESNNNSNMDICGDNIISINSSGNNDENGNGNNNISNNSNYSIARGNNSNSNIPAGHPYLSGSNRGYNRPNSATMGGIPVPIRGVGSGGPHSQFQSPLSAYPSGPPSAGFLASPLSATMGSPLNNIAASETSNKRKLSHEEAMQTVRERILARRAQQDPSNSSNSNPTSAANIGISDNSSASRLNNRRRHPHAPRTPSSATGPVSSTNDSIDNQRLESPLSSGLVSSVTAAKTHSANYGINTTSSNITGGNVTMSPNVRSSASPHGNLSPALQAIGSNKGRSASPLTVSATNNASSPYQLPAGSYQSQQYPQTSLSNANSNTSSLMTASIPTTTPLIPPRGSSTGAMSSGIVFQQYQSESQHHYQTQSHQPQLQHQLRGPTSPFVQPYSPQTQPPYQQQQQQQQMYHGQSQMQDEHAPISPVGTNAHVNSRNSSSSFGSSGSTNGMMRKLPYPVSTTTTPTNTTPSVRFPTIK